jgi:ribose 5-phosphate isomerase B
MVVYFATDHAGFALKEILLAYVRDELGYDVEDCGAYVYEADDDFPDYISIAAEKVSENPIDSCAIILGGSGQGEAMVANRTPHVRATVYYGGAPEIITLSREHNNANILSLGARFLKEEDAKDAVNAWLRASFTEDERHVRRIAKIDNSM